VRSTRVLMLTPSYYPIMGGAETIIQNLAVCLNSNGIQTDIMTFHMDTLWKPKWRGKTETSVQGFRVYRIPALNWVPFVHSNRITMGVNLIPGRFTNLLKNYDILHFHGELSFPLFSYFSGKPKIFHLHGLDFAFFQKYFLGRLILKNVADLYISLTNQMKKDLTLLGIPENKIRLLPNGIDVHFFHPGPQKEDDLILFVGRITFGKGLHVLLESLAYLKRPIRLVIIGPADWNSKYFNYVLRLIEKENKRKMHLVEYLGERNQENLVEWYQRASIFVLPPVGYEAMGVVYLEALACGTPVIATDVGGISEVVNDGENGYIVKPNDAIELANAIESLLDNGAIRKKLGQQGRKWVTENFSIEKSVHSLSRIYEDCLNSKTR